MDCLAEPVAEDAGDFESSPVARGQHTIRLFASIMRLNRAPGAAWRHMKYRSTILAAGLVFASAPAFSQTFSQFVGFGDSTIDSGAYRSLAAPGGGANFDALWLPAVAAGAGKPTTSPGLVSSEALAAAFGLSAIPSDQGGTNFATSGAKNVTINDAITGGFTAAVPTVTQIGNYLAATGGHANPNALYLISSGGNDVGFATGNNAPANPQAYLVSAANSLAGAVATLQASGARYIVVPNLPSSFPTDGGAGNAETRADRLLYNQTLWTSLGGVRREFHSGRL